MKYKIGDRVRVVDKKEMTYNSEVWVTPMLEFCGKVVTIVGITNRTGEWYEINEDGRHWNWDSPCFKKIYDIKLV